MFASIERYLYEIESLERYLQICLALEHDPNAMTFFKDHLQDCLTTPPRQLDLSQFALVTSHCLYGNACPMIKRSVVTSDIPGGIVLHRANAYLQCPKGILFIFLKINIF